MLFRCFIAIRNLAAFLAGIAIASTALSTLVPFPKIGSLWRKYQHLRENDGKYSLVFVGSSRVFHEFIPTQFDAALKARQHAIKSLNFGQDGMWPPETLYMVRQILAAHPKGLRWVMIDLMQIKPLLDGNETSQRSVYWHDWRHTWMALSHIASVTMEGQRSLEEKADLGLLHLHLWTLRFLSAGSGSERLQIAVKFEREKRFEPIADEGWEKGREGPLRGKDLEKFNEELAHLREMQPRPITPLMRQALNDLVTEVRAAGAEPVFVVPSSFYGRERFSDWPPPGVTLFAFDDPDKYPQFYDPKHRCDVHHLDPAMAAEFTRLLADRFAQLLEEKR